MDDHNAPDQKPKKTWQSLVAGVKKFSRDKPEIFALSLMAVSVMAIVAGTYLAGWSADSLF